MYRVPCFPISAYQLTFLNDLSFWKSQRLCKTKIVLFPKKTYFTSPHYLITEQQYGLFELIQTQNLAVNLTPSFFFFTFLPESNQSSLNSHSLWGLFHRWNPSIWPFKSRLSKWSPNLTSHAEFSCVQIAVVLIILFCLYICGVSCKLLCNYGLSEEFYTETT